MLISYLNCIKECHHLYPFPNIVLTISSKRMQLVTHVAFVNQISGYRILVVRPKQRLEVKIAISMSTHH
jgi:hypothetical protein